MRLEGSLDAFGLPDIFSLLSMTKKTGGLHLRRADAHGVVWLGEGLVTGGASDLARLSLGRRLAASGRVSDDSLSTAIEALTRSGGFGIAQELRDAGAIDEGELQAIVGEHIVDTVFDLMRWPDGVFEFVVDEANADDVGVLRQVDEVVTEARGRLETWASLDQSVVARETVLSLALDLDDNPKLSREEWALLALVNGSRTVGDLVTMCGRGDYSVVVALAELVGRGLLRTGDAEGVTAMQRRQELVASLETAVPVDDVSTVPASLASVPAPLVIADDPQPEPAAAEAAEVTDTADAADATDDESPALSEAMVVEEIVDMTVPEGVAADATDDEDDEDDEDTDDSDERAETTADEAEDETEDESDSVDNVSEISSISRSSGNAGAPIPARPELFQRGHDPEVQMPLVASAGGGAVAAASAMPAGLIERDPSVNKSLLLRLIAGVRGL